MIRCTRRATYSAIPDRHNFAAAVFRRVSLGSTRCSPKGKRYKTEALPHLAAERLDGPAARKNIDPFSRSNLRTLGPDDQKTVR